MDGLVTLAVGDDYLQRAAALALSAARFGFPTILMMKDTDPGEYEDLFHGVVSLDARSSVNRATRQRVWELKSASYECTAEFDRCMYVDADSLVIKNPTKLFDLVNELPVHTPGGRALRDDEHWCVPRTLTTRAVATGIGTSESRPIQTLNGGFLLWRRGERAARWFEDYIANFARIKSFYNEHDLTADAGDELCASLAFAAHGIELPKSDSSIGVWDALDLKLDIEHQEFSCRKAYYWEGHAFEPYIAHFGGGKVSPRYRQCVDYLLTANPSVSLPLFAEPRPPRIRPHDGYDFSNWPDLPKVSCQCITYGRPELLNEAVESFLRQDYPGEKELVILNDHEGVIIENPGIPDVHVFNLPRRFRTIGEKRNACCGLCHGEVIFPWDDDDIHLPWRISYSLARMTNRHYFKPDKLWYWTNGTLSVRKAIGHAMGAWSRELFDKVGGYDHIQSGQDQKIEDRFRDTGWKIVEETEVENLFYIYRFPGTGSYHLSAHGFGKGFEEAQRFVDANVKKGCYTLRPAWKADYIDLVKEQAQQELLVS